MPLIAVLIWIFLATEALASDPGAVVFSEIMWMGSSRSSADEWIELYNRTDREVDMTGWTITRLTRDGEQVMLTCPDAIIESNATFLIANYSPTDPNTLLAVLPNLVDKGMSLPNEKLQLSLYDGQGQLIDMADDGTGVPLAGDASLKRAMVRIDFTGDGTSKTSWLTAQEATGWQEGADEFGTPGSIPDFLRPMLPPATPVFFQTWGKFKKTYQ